MFPRIVTVRHIRDYILELTFRDGIVAELDLGPRIRGRAGVFEPLQDLAVFKQVRVDPDAGTLIWPNDVDLDPDVLYSLATGVPIPAYEAVT